MVLAVCTVNSYVLPVTGFTGYNTSANSTITIALSVPANSWSIQCTDTDGYNVLSTTTLVNATMVQDFIHNTATFVVPANGPSAIQFTSVVNNDPTSTFTFGVFVLDSFNRRLFFKNQSYESNATFGVVADLNKNQEIATGGGGGGSPTGPAGGDLEGSYPNPQVNSLTGTDGVIEINGTSTALDWSSGTINISLAGSFAAGYDGTTWSFGYPTTSFTVSPTAANLVFLGTHGSGFVAVNNTGDLSFASGVTPSGSAGGDLAGTYPNPTVTQARGLKSATTTISISGATAPTSGQVLTATSGTNATWQTPGTGGITQLTGDVTAGPGSGSVATTIVALTGSGSLVTVNAATLQFASGITPTISQAGNGNNQTAIFGQFNNANSQAAGGVGINGGTASGTTGLGGQATLVGGTSTDATGIGGSAYIQGGSGGAGSFSGATVQVGGGTASANGIITLTTAATTRMTVSAAGVVRINNLSTGLVHADSSGNLTSSTLVNADVSASAAIAVSKLAAGTANQVLINNATPTPAWTTLSGDVTNALGVMTVGQLQGSIVLSGTPASGNVLTATSSTAAHWAAPGGGSSVTGSGVWHSTSGTLDSAASLGTAGQFLLTNSGPTDTSWTSISGDVSASVSTVGKLTVTGIQGNTFTSGAPAKGQFVVATSTTNYGPVTLSGDIQESATTAGQVAVRAINGIGLSGTPSTGQVLTATSSSAANWQTPSSGGITALTGNVTASGSGSVAATVVKINGASVPAAGSLTTGNVLQVNGASSVTYAALNLAGGANYVTGNLPISNVAPGTSAQVLMSNATPATTWTTISGDATFGATGALTLATVNSNVGTFGSATSIPVVTVNAKGLITAVTTATPTVTVISGITVSGTPSVNQVLTATSSSAANWQTPGSAASVTGSGVWHSTSGALDSAASKGTAAQMLITNSGATDTGWVSLSGDATITAAGVVTNAKINGISVTGTPSTGQIITATSSSAATWQNAPSGSFTAGGDLSGTSSSQTVIGFNGVALSITSLATNQMLQYNGTNWVNVYKAAVTVATAITANTTLTKGFHVYPIGTLTVSITATLWSSPAVGDRATIKDQNGTCQQFVRDNAGTLAVVGFTCTVAPSSGTIDGQANYIIQTPYQSVDLVCTSASPVAWSVI